MKRLWRWYLIAFILCFVLSGGQKTAVNAQDETVTIEEQAQSLLNEMSAAERVGQVFLVPFVGDSAPENSDITDLILNYHIGGVVLLAENDNITGYGNLQNAPTQLAELTNDLQRLSLVGYTTAVTDTPLAEIDLTPESDAPPTIIPISSVTLAPGLPLFVAINQEGDGPTYSEIFNGLNPLPNNMTIGATWNPENAAIMGQITGKELDATGINMLFGPVLDILTNPSPLNENGLGTRSFGGDPYWVGLMGQAYTSGVHEGSNGRLAVIGKHFPGIGSSDRSLAEEIPTVRKTLEELRLSELIPFIAVTGGAASENEQVDGLLTSHIRYQGFQGNIQTSTAPVSFDRQAISSLLALPKFATWYANGGMVVSDALGVRAVERYYDDTEQEFPHRRVAKDAFLAGNDLLVLSDFALGDAPYEQQLENIQNTVLWFQELYDTDPAFKQRVDEAALRIIQTKLRQYDQDFSEENVLTDAAAVNETVNQGETAVFDIAQQAITLISPSPEQLLERLPSPPGPQDRIIIFTDMKEAEQCSSCPLQAFIKVDALENQILALYGPEASGQVQPEQITSYTLNELADFLAAGTEPIFLPTPTAVLEATIPPDTESDLGNTTDFNLTPEATATIPPGYLVQESFKEGADWIIFAMLEDNDVQPVHDFLAQRQDLFRNSRLIAYAFNAPYFLDSTEISKLTAYYGVYSKVDAFIDAAARALFMELPFTGRSPVNIPGVSYQINAQTSPNPSQVIELFIADEAGSTQSPASEAPLETAVGDTLHLQTGTITDYNGNPVPDGTLVQFIQVDRIQGTINIIDEVPTTNGIALLDYVLEARTGPGKFRITAVSGDAKSSQEIDIAIEEDAQVSIITPTSTPSPVPSPTNTATPTPTATPKPSPTATPVPPPPAPQEPTLNITLTDFATLIAVLTGLTMVTIAGYLLSLRDNAGLAQQISWVLWGLIGALLAYNYVALGLPGTAVFTFLGAWGGLLITLLGGAIGLALYTRTHSVNSKQ